jgi:hypothetical protein
MAGKTPRPPATEERTLIPVLRQCPECQHPLWWDYTHDRKVATLGGILQLWLHLLRCPHPTCGRDHRPYRPEEEGRLGLPHDEYGLDVLAWLGALRYQHDQTVMEIHREWVERGVSLSQPHVTSWLARYDERVALSLSAAPAPAGARAAHPGG